MGTTEGERREPSVVRSLRTELTKKSLLTVAGVVDYLRPQVVALIFMSF